ncbi:MULTISPECIES: hypothetical protein [Sphingobacterium]|nr:hypothetical protein [Sphingobacterium multivorum]
MAGNDGGPGALFKSYERMGGDGLEKKVLASCLLLTAWYPLQ